MSAARTPTPLTARVHKNGRDFEIVAGALRPEWVGTELGQNQVIATVSIGCFTDATGAARTLNEANAAFIVRACNSHDALVAALEDVLAAATAAINDRNITEHVRRAQCAHIARAALKAARGES